MRGGRLRRLGGVALAALAMAAAVSDAQAACRQALLLGVDVSGSVNPSEYRLQMDGIAHALTDPAVSALILANPEAPVALAVFEWSAADFQRVIVDWTEVTDAAALAAIAARLRATTRITGSPYSTGIGAALAFAAGMMARAPACWQQTFDISGDGKNNDGPNPRDAHEQGLTGTMTVNALVIGEDSTSAAHLRNNEMPELESYFRSLVIRGPGAFVQTALGYDDYARAMREKLIRELSGLVVSEAAPARIQPPPGP